MHLFLLLFWVVVIAGGTIFGANIIEHTYSNTYYAINLTDQQICDAIDITDHGKVYNAELVNTRETNNSIVYEFTYDTRLFDQDDLGRIIDDSGLPLYKRIEDALCNSITK